MEITPPVDHTQIKELRRWLALNANIELVSTDGTSSGEPSVIIDIKKPIPIVNILKMVPPVESVVRQNGTIRVTLKTTQPI